MVLICITITGTARCWPFERRQFECDCQESFAAAPRTSSCSRWFIITRLTAATWGQDASEIYSPLLCSSRWSPDARRLLRSLAATPQNNDVTGQWPRSVVHLLCSFNNVAEIPYRYCACFSLRVKASTNLWVIFCAGLFSVTTTRKSWWFKKLYKYVMGWLTEAYPKQSHIARLPVFNLCIHLSSRIILMAMNIPSYVDVLLSHGYCATGRKL